MINFGLLFIPCCDMMRILQFLLLFLLCFSITAQQDSVLYRKYEAYRMRLKYFVFFSNEPGGGLLANIRNRDVLINPDGMHNSGDETDYHPAITFGQTHTRTGYLLAVLATEYSLLMRSGEHELAQLVLREINCVLDAFDRTDRCESGPPWFGTDTLDGFFVREDAPPILSAQMHHGLNKDLMESHDFRKMLSDCRFGDPAYIHRNAVECLAMYTQPEGYFFSHREGSHPDSAAFALREQSFFRYYKNQKFTSQDEVLGSLVGLVLTIKLVDDSRVQARAKLHVLNMISFLSAGEQNWWRPAFPDGSKMGNNNGADARAYAFALKNIAFQCSSKDSLKKKYPSLARAPWCRTAFEGTEYASLSRVGLKEYRILRFLMAEALALSGSSCLFQNVGREISIITAPYDWDTFFLLLYAVVHQVSVDELPFDSQKLAKQLNEAPQRGTWAYTTGTPALIKGWSAEFKWSATPEAQNGQNNERWALGNYSGIDFMLLYNLACLKIDSYYAGYQQNLKADSCR